MRNPYFTTAAIVFCSALYTSCNTGSQSSASDSTADSVSTESDITEGIATEPEGMDPVIRQLYPADTAQQGEYQKEDVHVDLLAVRSQEDGLVMENVTVVFILAKNEAGNDGPYQNYCPKLAIFSNDPAGGITLVASLDLDCFTNYDDSMTSLSFTPYDLGNGTSLIGISAENKGYGADREESNTTLLLYALEDDQLVQVWTGVLSKSKSEGESSVEGSGQISFSDNKTGVPDLVYEFKEGEDTEKKIYMWNGNTFTLKN